MIWTSLLLFWKTSVLVARNITVLIMVWWNKGYREHYNYILQVCLVWFNDYLDLFLWTLAIEIFLFDFFLSQIMDKVVMKLKSIKGVVPKISSSTYVWGQGKLRKEKNKKNLWTIYFDSCMIVFIIAPHFQLWPALVFYLHVVEILFLADWMMNCIADLPFTTFCIEGKLKTGWNFATNSSTL